MNQEELLNKIEKIEEQIKSIDEFTYRLAIKLDQRDYISRSCYKYKTFMTEQEFKAGPFQSNSLMHGFKLDPSEYKEIAVPPKRFRQQALERMKKYADRAIPGWESRQKYEDIKGWDELIANEEAKENPDQDILNNYRKNKAKLMNKVASSTSSSEPAPSRPWPPEPSQ